MLSFDEIRYQIYHDIYYSHKTFENEGFVTHFSKQVDFSKYSRNFIHNIVRAIGDVDLYPLEEFMWLTRNNTVV